MDKVDKNVDTSGGKVKVLEPWSVYHLGHDVVLVRVIDDYDRYEFLHNAYWNGIRTFETREVAQAVADRLNRK